MAGPVLTTTGAAAGAAAGAATGAAGLSGALSHLRIAPDSTESPFVAMLVSHGIDPSWATTFAANPHHTHLLQALQDHLARYPLGQGGTPSDQPHALLRRLIGIHQSQSDAPPLDLSALDLRGISFGTIDRMTPPIRDRIIRHVIFKRVQFKQADLSGCCFIGCTFNDAKFEEAQLNSSTFVNCSFLSAHFNGASFKTAALKYEAPIAAAHNACVSASMSRGDGVYFPALFSGCDLRGSTFEQTDILSTIWLDHCRIGTSFNRAWGDLYGPRCIGKMEGCSDISLILFKKLIAGEPAEGIMSLAPRSVSACSVDMPHRDYDQLHRLYQNLFRPGPHHPPTFYFSPASLCQDKPKFSEDDWRAFKPSFAVWLNDMGHLDPSTHQLTEQSEKKLMDYRHSVSHDIFSVFVQELMDIKQSATDLDTFRRADRVLTFWVEKARVYVNPETRAAYNAQAGAADPSIINAQTLLSSPNPSPFKSFLLKQYISSLFHADTSPHEPPVPASFPDPADQRLAMQWAIALETNPDLLTQLRDPVCVALAPLFGPPVVTDIATLLSAFKMGMSTDPHQPAINRETLSTLMANGVCPISHDNWTPKTGVYRTSANHSYGPTIVGWVASHNSDPITRERLTPHLFSDDARGLLPSNWNPNLMPDIPMMALIGIVHTITSTGTFNQSEFIRLISSVDTQALSPEARTLIEVLCNPSLTHDSSALSR